jgi:hypothetical protein
MKSGEMEMEMDMEMGMEMGIAVERGAITAMKSGEMGMGMGMGAGATVRDGETVPSKRPRRSRLQ